MKKNLYQLSMDDILMDIPEREKEFNAVVTVTLGELLRDDFDWGRDEWPAVDEEHRARFNKKFEDRYYYREISEVPPGKFKLFVQRKLNEIMPKYKHLIDVINSERMSVIETGTTNQKARAIHSEYPQAQIAGDNDYATNAQDSQGIGSATGPVIDMMVDFESRYHDVDVLMLNELEVCFSSLITVNTNGW